MNPTSRRAPSSRPSSAYAASTFPHFPAAHKALLEAAIVRRREAERDRTEYWTKAKTYYDRVERSNGRHELWNSDEAIKEREAARDRDADREDKRRNLLVRRERLRHLLETEREQYQEELRRVSRGAGPEGRAAILDLRSAREELRKEREARQQKEAEEKMLQHWKINNPEFREVQMKKRSQLVQRAWEEQKQEQDARREEEMAVERERMRKEAEENARMELMQRERDVEREAKLTEWKDSVLRQIEELREKREQEKRLREEMAREEESKRRVQEVEEKRRLMEERRKRLDMGHYLQRQHKLRLRSHAAAVQKELDDDRRTLEELQKFESTREEQDELKRERRRKELQWMRQVLIEQKEEEKRRAKQMELLFTEEAETAWDRQERLWKEEKKARQKLMEDVLNGWKDQIQEKIDTAKEREDLLAVQREELEREIESLNAQIEEEERRREARVALRREEREAEVERQRAEKDRRREERFRKDNELAETLAKWKLEDKDYVSDFRRRKAKWY